MTPAEWYKETLSRIDYFMALGVWKRDERDEMHSLASAVQAYGT